MPALTQARYTRVCVKGRGGELGCCCYISPKGSLSHCNALTPPWCGGPLKQLQILHHSFTFLFSTCVPPPPAHPSHHHFHPPPYTPLPPPPPCPCAASQHLALLCLGEVGRRTDLSGVSAVDGAINTALSSDSEDIKTAASLALGGVACGNLAKYLPTLLNSIQVRQAGCYQSRQVCCQRQLGQSEGLQGVATLSSLRLLRLDRASLTAPLSSRVFYSHSFPVFTTARCCYLPGSPQAMLLPFLLLPVWCHIG